MRRSCVYSVPFGAWWPESTPLSDVATGLLSYQSIGSGVQEMRRTMAILPTTLICQDTQAGLPYSALKTRDQTGHAMLMVKQTRQLACPIQAKSLAAWIYGNQTAAVHRRKWQTSCSQDINLHFSNQRVCLFLMQPPHIAVLVCCLCLEVARKREGGRNKDTDRDRSRDTERETKAETNVGKEGERETRGGILDVCTASRGITYSV